MHFTKLYCTTKSYHCFTKLQTIMIVGFLGAYIALWHVADFHNPWASKISSNIAHLEAQDYLMLSPEEAQYQTAPDTGIDAFRKTNTSFSQPVTLPLLKGRKFATGVPSIVLCHLGDTFRHGEHIIFALLQARKFNPSTPIYLIASKKVVDQKLFPEIVKMGIIHVYAESMKDDLFIKQFFKRFVVSGNMAVGKNSGNKNFNKVTMARLFYVHKLMTDLKLTKVFHLENDNLIYFSIDKYATSAEQCKLKVGLEARELLDDTRPARQFLIAGTMYIHDANALKAVLDYSIDLLKLGVRHIKKKLKHSQINDMTLLALYYLDKGRKLQSMTILPENPQIDEPNRGTWKGRDKVQKCLQEKAKIIFDNAAISIWNGGTFHDKKKQPFRSTTMASAWYAYSRVDARKYDLMWTNNCFDHGDNSTAALLICNCPFIVGKKGTQYAGQHALVGSLHMHSKELRKFLSKCQKK